MLSPPDELDEWFEGEIDGLEEMFEAKLKKEGLASLSENDPYFQPQFIDGAMLPERWHEGHQPYPYFWSEKQWDWVAKGGIVVLCQHISSLTKLHFAGNSFWHKPIDLLYFVMTDGTPSVTFKDFIQVLDSLLHIVVPTPKLDEARHMAKQLWMGEMTWREFVEAMMKDHLHRLPDATSYTSEKRGIQLLTNIFFLFLIDYSSTPREEKHVSDSGGAVGPGGICSQEKNAQEQGKTLG
jgi:hypothetical protein